MINGIQMFTVTPEKDTTFYINKTQGSSCYMCTKVPGIKPERQCYDNLPLNKNTPVTIEFHCSRPQDVFIVEIVRNIACTSTSCGRIIQSDFGSSGLLDFPRRFTWKIKAYPQKSFQINFAKTGLSQIAPTDSCNDKHTYTLRAADVLLGKYCSSGPISNAQILNQGSFSLDLPAGQKPKPDQFDVFVAAKIDTIGNISVTLLKESSSTLMSPNYPRSFPNDDVIEWYFQVPNEHKAAIKFMNLTLPTCLKDQTGVEYSSREKTQVVRLNEVQPEQNEGSFSLRLRNCKMDTTRSGSAGLSMKFNVSAYQGVKILTVTPEKDTTVYINNTEARSCKVCKVTKVPGNLPDRQCHSNLTLSSTTTVTLEFDCLRTQDAFTMEIVRNIACTSKSCGRITQSDISSSDLLDFHRIFTWKIKAYPQKSFQINFAEKGLSQIAPTDSCNDKHTYTLRAADVLLGKYCSSGPISNAQIMNQGSFSLDLPAGQRLRPGRFDVFVVEEIPIIANISVTLLKESSSTLMSPNYPRSFPDNDVMEWYFQVPNEHKAAIKLLNLTLPTCLKKKIALEYSSRGKPQAQVVRLDQIQPEQNEGSFSLRLRNCEMDTTRSGSAGLSMKFKVSAYQGVQILTVKPEKNTTIYINNTKASSCKVCNYKEVPGNIPKQQCHSNLTLINNNPGTIEFDCSRSQDEFTVEIVHNIECTSNLCAQIIQSDGGFPDFLNFSRRFTWKIKAYPQKSFQINFAEKGLSQIAPTDSCNDKHTYTLRAADVLLGKYCSSGPISNAQILNQGSFSLDLPAGQKPKPHQFHVSVGEKINTIANISVTLLKGSMSSTLMLPIYRDNVPNGGMEWYFQVPDKHNATIKFLNHILPNCSDKQMELEYTGSKGTTQVGRLDDLQPIQNQGSFTLRLRNCKVVRTRASTNQGAKLKPILGAVAALFLISIIVLLVVCFVIKKKRKGQSPAVAAENPDRNVPKEPNNHPEDCNDRNHVYATIDDSLVYSHLLNKLKGGEHYDSYQSLDIKPKKPSVYEDVGGDSSVPLLQSKQGQPLSNKASSYVELVVVNNVYDLEQNNQEECPSLEPHLELKGEN
ncbi:CUB domain-containing protein 1 [Fundulus heteroclitus]|uniref:CUB domain-containing protein 1 n=1 Tax=Fundulus heteroclitus TaxID=8078 RepID=UPI00165AB599|nr:CUB domain-containing protein 1 [Fundulus heteroclitus]